MADNDLVKKAPLPWWLGGLLLGLVQVFAVAVSGPLGVSTQFPVVESIAIHEVAPEYAQAHPLLSEEKYKKIGGGFWLDIGLIAGALVGAIASRRWRISAMPVWWRKNYGSSTISRFVTGFFGGLLVLLGARFAHGCTSGQFASGWAQLSLSAIPFTIAMFVAALITVRLLYPKVPDIE